MSAFFIFVAVGLAVCGFLLHRQARRQPTPPVKVRRTDDLRPVNAWQGGVKLAPLGEDMNGLRLRLKLRHEEERQRPEEGRN